MTTWAAIDKLAAAACWAAALLTTATTCLAGATGESEVPANLGCSPYQSVVLRYDYAAKHHRWGSGYHWGRINREFYSATWLAVGPEVALTTDRLHGVAGVEALVRARTGGVSGDMLPGYAFEGAVSVAVDSEPVVPTASVGFLLSAWVAEYGIILQVPLGPEPDWISPFWFAVRVHIPTVL